MNDFHPWQSRPKRRIPWGWIVAIAALALLASGCWLASMAEGAGIPPRPGTQSKAPPPPSRQDKLRYCRNFAPRPATDRYCREARGYR